MNKRAVCMQYGVSMMFLFVFLFEILSYGMINSREELSEHSYSSRISLYFIPIFAYVAFCIVINLLQTSAKAAGPDGSSSISALNWKLTEHKNLVVIFFLYIFDWVCSLLAHIYIIFRLILDQEEAYFEKGLPVRPCKHRCSYYSTGIPKDSLVIVCWCLFGGILSDVLYRTSQKGGGRKLSIALVVGFKLYRNVNNSLLFIMIEPYSTSFIMTTVVELVFQIVLNTGLHMTFLGWCSKSKLNEDVVDKDLEKGKVSSTLVNRAIKGIYSMHTYTTSRIVMITVLCLQALFDKYFGWDTKRYSAFSNSAIETNRSLYISGCIFQCVVSIIGTSLVRAYWSYRLRLLRSNNGKTADTQKRVSKKRRRTSLFENLVMYENPQGTKYTLSAHMKEVYPLMSRLMKAFFIFGVLNPMLHFRSQYMHARNVYGVIDQTKNRNDEFIEWMKSSSTDWSVARSLNTNSSSSTFNYEQCLCLDE